MWGLVHAVNGALSIRHWNVLPPSVEVKEKSGAVSYIVLPLPGTRVVEVSGGVVSGVLTDTVKLRLAGDASALLLGSVEKTWKVWGPLPRVPVVWGVVHAVNGALSTRHWNVLPPSVEVKEKSGVASLIVLPSAGPAVIEVSGGVVSGGPEIVKLRVAGEASVLPAASVAFTRNV